MWHATQYCNLAK